MPEQGGQLCLLGVGSQLGGRRGGAGQRCRTPQSCPGCAPAPPAAAPRRRRTCGPVSSPGSAHHPAVAQQPRLMLTLLPGVRYRPWSLCRPGPRQEELEEVDVDCRAAACRDAPRDSARGCRRWGSGGRARRNGLVSTTVGGVERAAPWSATAAPVCPPKHPVDPPRSKFRLPLRLRRRDQLPRRHPDGPHPSREVRRSPALRPSRARGEDATRARSEGARRGRGREASVRAWRHCIVDSDGELGEHEVTVSVVLAAVGVGAWGVADDAIQVGALPIPVGAPRLGASRLGALVWWAEPTVRHESTLMTKVGPRHGQPARNPSQARDLGLVGHHERVWAPGAGPHAHITDDPSRSRGRCQLAIAVESVGTSGTLQRRDSFVVMISYALQRSSSITASVARLTTP